MVKNQKGFTLIEALITLSISGILILVTSPSLIKLYDYINLNQTLSTIQGDLAYMRQNNMMVKSSGHPMNLKIYRTKGYYDLISTDGSILYARRTLPPGINVIGSSNIITITFNPLGHVEKGQTLTVKSHHFQKSIVFSIGAGGVDIR